MIESVHLTVGETTVDVTSQVKASDMPMTGSLLKAVISSFTQNPIQGDDTWEHCSVGVARNSVVATDSLSAIMIGEDATDHVATLRKEALLEAQRSNLYGVAVRLDDIHRNCDQGSGLPKPMPHVQEIIRRNLSGMKPIAVVDPQALLAVGKVASAAGAMGVSLFQPEGDPSALGFEFTFAPDMRHVNLFSTWEGNIRARGVFRAERGMGTTVQRMQGEEVQQPLTAPETVKKSKKKAVEEHQESEVVTLPSHEPEPIDVYAVRAQGGYQLPSLTLLDRFDTGQADAGGYERGIMEVLRENNVPGRIVAVSTGPTVTLYELEVSAGPALKKVAAMGDQLQMQLAVKSVRIQAPIPGKKAIGIEIPNKLPRKVNLFEMCATREFLESDAKLLMALGQDVAGRQVMADLTGMPHLLIAGATNSGKSIGIASVLCSLLLRKTPKELRLVLIDPKQVELSLFGALPHLMCPVVTDVKESAGVLRALVREMERRYDLCKGLGVRNIAGYHGKAEPETMPYIAIVVDELADLIMQVGSEVEGLLVRLGQKARAVGIHLIVATQRPSADIITGLIKANVPSRIAFAVASQVDSRVILDSPGAEKLLGRGDMLFSPIDAGGKTTRVQGAYVSEEEVERVCAHWASLEPQKFSIRHQAEEQSIDEDDELYTEACHFVLERGEASTSALQRRFAIGFAKASAFLDQMQEQGFITERDGPRPRKVLEEPLEEWLGSRE